MRVLVIGAGGYVGSAAAEALGDAGHEVVGVSRRTTPAVDVADANSVRSLFETVGQVDAVVTAVGHVPFRPLAELDRDDYLAAFLGKALCQIDVVRIGTPYVRDGGSFALTTGILAREPILSGAAGSMANGAIEAFVLAAACELPRGIRINAISPTVLAEATSHHALWPGFPQVPAAHVGRAFLKAVAGIQTGKILALEGC